MLYTPTNLGWSPDGLKLASGGSTRRTDYITFSNSTNNLTL